MSGIAVPLFSEWNGGRRSRAIEDVGTILRRWLGRRAGKFATFVLRLAITCLAVGGIITLFSRFGPELVISNSKSPAFLHTISPWRQACASPLYGSTSRHFAYHRRPKFPTLPFPSWGKYEPLSSLWPDNPAWPYATDKVPRPRPDDGVPPVGVFIALLCTAHEVSRREMIRRTYNASRWGAEADGLAGVSVRFFVGRPKSASVAVMLEAERKLYGDIIILPIVENLNRGKTFAFFEWAAYNARVPACSYHENRLSWVANCTGETTPDYVVKADMDTFLVLPAVERRLRMLPRTKVYWGRMVFGRDGLLARGDYMAGAGYGLSFDMVRHFAVSPFVRAHKRGNEDQRVADWVRSHPEADRVLWISEECWTYTHPRSAQTWSHGFLYPSTVQAMQHGKTANLTPAWLPPDKIGSWSTTSPSRKKYTPVSSTLTPEQEAEALVEGSKLSLLHPHNLQHPLGKDELERRIEEAYRSKQPAEERMAGWEAGSTLWVHAVKRDEWWHDAERAFQG